MCPPKFVVIVRLQDQRLEAMLTGGMFNPSTVPS
jgi:hypothetical protein